MTSSPARCEGVRDAVPPPLRVAVPPPGIDLTAAERAAADLLDEVGVDRDSEGRRVRVERWATALRQPATAAAVMHGGDAHYTALPYSLATSTTTAWNASATP